ncbi:MAG TPA: DUF305 domain-containing protein [Pyrinomonadaceae bacterium]|nr:DUF305 domain-containing protein [Pyrinomonadaceae bacterium]
MKTIILTVVLSIAAIAFAACGQPATNSNSAMNHGGMNHNSMMNSNSMNMNGMNHNSMPMNSNMPMNHSEMKSDPNAASAPYDLQFIDTMTAHHSGAVDMAKMVDGRTQNADLKKFAAEIIKDQEKEIAEMKEWREKWFKGAPRAMNMEMPGMMDSMKMDMSKLSNSKDKSFDLAFIEMMIPHHAGAVSMAKEALTKSEKPEIKTLAGNIIKAQEAEIKMMNEWKEKWSK